VDNKTPPLEAIVVKETQHTSVLGDLLAFIEDPKNKTAVQWGAAAVNAAVNTGILWYVNHDHGLPLLNPASELKIGLSFVYPLAVMRGYDSLTRRLGVKTHAKAQMSYTALNWLWGLGVEAPLYALVGNPNAMKSAIIFSAISQATGSYAIYEHYHGHPVTRSVVAALRDVLSVVYYPFDLIASSVNGLRNGKKTIEKE